MASAESADPKRPLFKRWRIWLGLLVLSPLLLWGGLLLAFMTPWAKSWVASRIQQRTGVELQIGGIGFIPGGRVWLSDVEWKNAGMISRIEVSPRWAGLLKRELDFTEVKVIEPQLDLSLSELQTLMPVPVSAPVPPPEQADPQSQPSTPGTTSPPPPTPVPVEPEGGAITPKPPSAVGPAPAPLPQAPVTPQVQVASQWLRLLGGSIKVRKSPESPVFLDLSGLDVELPLNGDRDPGAIKVARLSAFGMDFPADQQWQVSNLNNEWQAHVLGEKPELGKFEARLRMSRVTGFPFLFDASATSQQKFEFDGAAVHGALLGRISAGGVLKNAASWRGNIDLFGSRVRLSMGNTQLAYFDEMQGRAILAGPRIPLAEFRGQGDQGALIALGEASSQGLDGWVRVVVAPAYQDQLNRSLERVVPDWRAAELDTADRYFVDLRGFYKHGQFWIDTGQLEQSLPLSEVRQKIEQGLANPAQFGVERTD